jgi:streptogramin lyase
LKSILATVPLAAVLAFAPPVASTAAGHARPGVIQKGSTPLNWERFALSIPASSKVVGIASGRSGNAMWFTNASNDTLNGFTMQATLATYALNPIVGGRPRPFQPAYLTAGADARLYMGGCVVTGSTCANGFVVAATAAGALTAYATPGGQGPGPTGKLVLGNDGNVWFPDGTTVAKMTPGGAITEYPTGATLYGDVVAGSDGKIWFDQQTGSTNFAVGFFDPTSGKVRTFPVSSAFCTTLSGLAEAADQRVYVDCINQFPPIFLTYYLVGFASDGSQIAVPDLPGAGAMAQGPDGAVWFETDAAPNSPPDTSLLGRFDPLSSTISTYEAPFSGGLGFISSIAAGPDGNVWALDQGGGSPAIDVYIRNELAVVPSSLTLTSGQNATLKATYTGTGVLSATSSNMSVVTVVPGSKAKTWVATAHNAGTATIVVADAIHNSFNVPVTVTAASRSRESRGMKRMRASPALSWKQYAAQVPTPSALVGIVAGPDGALWYTESHDGLLVRMTTSGTVTRYTLTSGGKLFMPGYLAVGADQRLYIGGCLIHGSQCSQAAIGVATTSGVFTAYRTLSGDGAGLVNRPGLGPDGNVWVPEFFHIAKMTPAGSIVEYPDPSTSPPTPDTNAGAAAGADGNLWVNFSPLGEVLKVTPSSGHFSAFKLVQTKTACGLSQNDIAAARDGFLYAGCGSLNGGVGGLFQISTAGASTYFTDGWGASFGPIAGPDHRPWFFGDRSPNEQLGAGVFQEFLSGTNAIATYLPPYSNANVAAIATGPDGNVWALDRNGFVDVLVLR